MEFVPAALVEEVFVRDALVMELKVAGQVIETTAEHPYYVADRGWTACNELQVGDRIALDHGWTAVEEVNDTTRWETVYNFRIAEHHTYFVGCDEWGFSVWAHNVYNVRNMVRQGDDVVIVSKTQARQQSLPQTGGRQVGIDRAWVLEMELVAKSGKGTAPWTDAQIKQIRDMQHYLETGENIGRFTTSQLTHIDRGVGYRVLNYTGHHINMVETHPQWQADPRNIAFLEQGSGNSHMTLGHPGGTKVFQPGSDLIDRRAMLDKIDH